MTTEKAREMQAMTSSVICGHGLPCADQAGRLFRGGIDLVALKIVKVVLSIERMISEHEKLTPRSTILAMRTRVLIFCRQCQWKRVVTGKTAALTKSLAWETSVFCSS